MKTHMEVERRNESAYWNAAGFITIVTTLCGRKLNGWADTGTNPESVTCAQCLRAMNSVVSRPTGAGENER